MMQALFEYLLIMTGAKAGGACAAAAALGPRMCRSSTPSPPASPAVDPASPYDSLAEVRGGRVSAALSSRGTPLSPPACPLCCGMQALLDSVGRKVGACLEGQDA